MSIKKYIERFERIDRLIRLRATGTPKELAQKLNISEALLYETLAEMKELGAPICYNKNFNSYYYTECIEFNLSFKPINSNQEKITQLF